MYIPEATYLAWVDLSKCLPDVEDLPDFFANKAGVLLEGGNSLFVGNAAGYIRLNLAMPRSILKTGLERMRELMHRLGNPQDSLKFIHVAGTNGKGSTCAMLESVLRRAGYHTGLYTSPFLQAYQGKRHEYDNLLTYFLYRHFMKALGDDAVQDKVQLALVSTAVIQLLDVYEWLAKGEVTHWAQICICKAYSREIEYNEDNTEQLAAFSVLDEME